MGDFKAIETRYAGYRFRSRLEARWAVFFDALEEAWEYEPEGFKLPSGPYLPDFWLPRLKTWVEIKATEPTEEEKKKCADLLKATDNTVLLLNGTPGDEKCMMFCWLRKQEGDFCVAGPAELGVNPSEDSLFFYHVGGDEDRLFADPGMTKPIPGVQNFTDAFCGKIPYLISTNRERIESARQAARGARFEHGERPVF